MNFEDLNKYRAIKAWNTGDNIRLDLFIAMALMIVIWFPIEYNDAQATNEGGKGLKSGSYDKYEPHRSTCSD